MLHEFLTANHADLIDRCRRKVAQRSAPRVTDVELAHGIPLFLDQMIKTLRVEQTSDPMLSRKVSGPSGGGGAFLSEIGASATLHGRELLRNGFTVEQVVHDYGDLCQAITDLAFESGTPIATDEFRTLNRCIDNGIAEAVTEYSYQRSSLIADRSARALNERLGILAHELRNLIHTATLAVTAIKKGNVGIGGATGAVLDRSLIGLRSLIDRSLAEVRLTAGMPGQQRPIPLVDFVVEVEVSAALEAGAHGCKLAVFDVDPRLAVDGDRDMLLAAVGNLLQNAFKFTQAHTEVSLRVHAVADRILIEVEDHCGGLPPGVAEDLFQPFRQSSEDKSGLGLGLAICRRSIEANNGVLRVRDKPGVGCVFTIDLPRCTVAQPAISLSPDPAGSATTR
jgi:signal transduction histidine kinase